MSPSEPSTPGRPGRRRKNSEPDESRTSTAPSAEGGRRRGGGRRKKEAGRPGRTLIIVVVALVVVLAVLGTFLFLRFTGDEGEDAAAQQTRPVVYKVRDAGSMNEVLASREVDSRPLNEGELFERRNAEISSQSIDFTLRDSDLTEDCSAAVWGQEVTDALAAADCSQAGRATYVADGYFGVAAVFNLADVEGSRAVADAMEAPEPEDGESAEEVVDPGFLLAPSGSDPFDRLGSGYSAADAIVSGHYLVVVWVQPTDSESVEERVTLSTPLVALANFREPLFRRLVEYSDGDEGGETGTGETDTTGEGAPAEPGTEGVGETGSGEAGVSAEPGTEEVPQEQVPVEPGG
ncbi:hypothetical protein [Nocardiopsis alba]|uniref:hypothetical protein n=1 Tax=Nocardiopsis alba TaxID=53437 RepID=UPI0035DF3294